jgi:hypothetical protein
MSVASAYAGTQAQQREARGRGGRHVFSLFLRFSSDGSRRFKGFEFQSDSGLKKNSLS